MERQLPDSLYRARRLRRLLKKPDEVTTEDISAALGDHFADRPVSVATSTRMCTHTNARRQT